MTPLATFNFIEAAHLYELFNHAHIEAYFRHHHAINFLLDIDFHKNHIQDLQ
jgi:hypothetical protein